MQSLRDKIADNPYITRIAELAIRREPILIGLSQDLFSSAGIDVGTLRLLRTLLRAGSVLLDGDAPPRVLDVGCGVGVLGIAAVLAREGVTATLSDRDQLAVMVARRNAALLGLAKSSAPRIRALSAGLGFAPARQDDAAPYDLILTNIPAKVGANGLREILFGAGPLLKPGGVIAFVHVTPLSDVIAEIVQERVEAGVEIEVLKESRGREHVALHWRFPNGLPPLVENAATPNDPLDPWRKEDAPKKILLQNLPVLPHQAAQDVGEFDTPHFQTPLAQALVHSTRNPEFLDAPERVLVLNPSHGFLAQMIMHRREPKELAILTRDALEHEVAKRNLDASIVKHGLNTKRIDPPTMEETPWLPTAAERDEDAYDLIIGPLRWNEGRAAARHTLAALKDAMRSDGRSLLILTVTSGQAELLKKVARETGLRTGRATHRKGYAALVMRRMRDGLSPEDEPEDPDNLDDVDDLDDLGDHDDHDDQDPEEDHDPFAD